VRNIKEASMRQRTCSGGGDTDDWDDTPASEQGNDGNDSADTAGK
jgi:hypothetical protein